MDKISKNQNSDNLFSQNQASFAKMFPYSIFFHFENGEAKEKMWLIQIEFQNLLKLNYPLRFDLKTTTLVKTSIFYSSSK